jgi:HTH-type transcriptional regulator/antitoxin HigA
MVEALPGSKIDGVCFWLNEVSPVVAVSSRFDRIDNFWFVLRNELEHVDRRHGLSAVMLDTELKATGQALGTAWRKKNASPMKLQQSSVCRRE